MQIPLVIRAFNDDINGLRAVLRLHIEGRRNLKTFRQRVGSVIVQFKAIVPIPFIIVQSAVVGFITRIIAILVTFPFPYELQLIFFRNIPGILHPTFRNGINAHPKRVGCFKGTVVIRGTPPFIVNRRAGFFDMKAIVALLDFDGNCIFRHIPVRIRHRECKLV